MSLIKSISGIRGTIGGRPGDGLSPLDIVKFASAYGIWIKQTYGSTKPSIVIGRDARLSGEMVNNIVCGTIIGLGIDVIDVGLSTTPTVEIAVTELKTDGGIILTASHNPKQWNALKLLNNKGEFISDSEGKFILELADKEDFNYADVSDLGVYSQRNDLITLHINKVLALPYVDVDAIKKANFKVVVDAVNSTGGFVIPQLLEALGVQTIHKIHCEPTGHFAHNPEPLPEHLRDLAAEVVKTNSDVGISVDPDVDRLALVCEDGEMFGEEYTLVTVADAVLQYHKGGNTVSNLSSTRALRDVTEKIGGSYSARAVGEVNVVNMMKETNAIIGGEGNGGIIYPELHYGRDSLVGVALFLTYLANQDKTVAELRASYPQYYMSKNKIELTPQIDVDAILVAMTDKYKNENITTIDGVKIDFATDWVHLRKSNTEPIIRIYTEAPTQEQADDLAFRIIDEIKAVAGL